MFKLTKARLAVFVGLVTLSFSPLVLFGSGPALILPVMQVFWLAGLAHARGVAVTDGPGVDAFNLIPANAIGGVLVLVGVAISLAGYYALASVLVASFSHRK